MTIAELERRRAELMAADPLKPGTYRYTAPDGTVTVRRLPMDRWDEIHDRLEAQGMCKPWDAVQERVWRALLRSDGVGRGNGRHEYGKRS